VNIAYEKPNSKFEEDNNDLIEITHEMKNMMNHVIAYKTNPMKTVSLIKI